MLAVTGASPPALNSAFFAYAAAGAATQIAATALMLTAMRDRDRGFVVVTAWIKTEPIQVAVFGLIVLGDPSSWVAASGYRPGHAGRSAAFG